MYVLSSVPKSTCYTSFSFANILPCVRGLYIRCSNRSASASLESCTACTMRSAPSSVSITRVRYRCRETWICSASQRAVSIGPCAGSSMAVTNSGYLSPLHMTYAVNLKYRSCHFVSSPRKTGGFPSRASRRFVAGCVAVAPAAAASHLLESLDLCRQLSNPALVFFWLLRSIHGLPSPHSCRLAPLLLLVFRCLPRETRCRPRSAITHGYVILQRTSSAAMLTDVYHTCAQHATPVSLEPSDR